MGNIQFRSSLRYICTLLSAIVPVLASAQNPGELTCTEITKIPLHADQLYTNVIDTNHGSYFSVRNGNLTSVFRVQRNLAAGSLDILPVMSDTGPGSVSTAFSNGKVVFTRTHTQPVTLSGFVSSTTSVSVPAYTLSSGIENLTASFSATSQSNMTPLSSSPFWQKRAPYSSWEQRVCPSGSQNSGQLGRVMTNLGSGNLVVANNFEFSSRYFDLPYSCGQQVYERNADGSTKMRVAASSQAPGFYCDLTNPIPGVIGCQPVGSYSNPSCIDLIPTPTAVPAAPPVPEAPPIPSTPPSPACTVRMQPDPIENAPGQAMEFCPTCPYYWWAMDPGFTIYAPLDSGQMVRSGSFRFPTSFSTEHIELPIPSNEFSLGEILQLRPDSITGGFAAATELSANNYPELTNIGGVYFFDSNGGFKGFASTFFENGRSGSSLAALGTYDNSTAYAVGSPERGVFHPDTTQFPPQWANVLRPEAGHVLFTKDTGELIGLYFGAEAGDMFGNSVATLGDVDNDGAPEAVIAAPGGSYIAFAKASFDESPNNVLTLRNPNSSGFGRLVGTISTSGSNVADIAIVASANELLFYDVANCLESNSLIQNSAYIQLVLSQVQRAIDALDAVPPPAAAVSALSNLEQQIGILTEMILGTGILLDINSISNQIESHYAGLKSSTQSQDLKLGEVRNLEATQIQAQKKINKFKNKKKKANGWLSVKDAKNFKKNKRIKKTVGNSLITSQGELQTASSNIATSRQQLRSVLVHLKSRLSP